MRTEVSNCDIDIKRKHVVLTGRVRSHTYDFLTLPQRWFCPEISVNHIEKHNRSCNQLSLIIYSVRRPVVHKVAFSSVVPLARSLTMNNS